MYKMMISLLGALALAGCATTANYQQVVNHWQGAPARDLIAAWGSPDAAVKLADGNTIYMYTRQQLSNAPVGTTPVASPVFNSTGMPITSPGFNDVFSRRTPAIDLYCRTWFEANPRGIIVNAQFQGSNCIASSPNSVKP